MDIGTFNKPIGMEIEELIKIIETPSIVDELSNQLYKITKGFKLPDPIYRESYINMFKLSRYSYDKPVFTFYRIHTSYHVKYNHKTNIWSFIGTGKH
jgi:hypothetical protein